MRCAISVSASRFEVVGISRGEPVADENAARWFRSPSRKVSTSRITEPLPERVSAVNSQQIFVEKQGLPSSLLNQIKRLAAFPNPEFYKKQAMRLSTALTPRIISCAEDLPDHVGLPRGCMDDLRELLRENSVTLVLEDRRDAGVPYEVSFHGELNKAQERAVRDMLAHDDGVFVAPPASGKTVVGIKLIAARGRNALVLVHRAQLVKANVTRYLTRELRLTVNEKKSRVAPISKCVFLGFTFYRGTKLLWSDEAFADFRHRLKRYTGRSWGVSMEHRLRKLSEYLRGWMGYFGISDYYNPVVEVDHWLRRRVRMCYWKQWRYVRTKVRNLLALGTNKKQAIFTAISRKSYWHLSKTLATQSGMTNEWLKKQGLLSIRDRVDESPRVRLRGTEEGPSTPCGEPPSADPHARWCGGREVKAPAYPIVPSL